MISFSNTSSITLHKNDEKRSMNNDSCESCQLRRNSKFADVSFCNLPLLDKEKSCQTFKRGQLLLHEGGRPHGVFCIKSGKVKVFKLGSQGREQITTVLKAGDLIGYRAMLSDSQYHVSVEALEDTVACHIPKESFLEIFHKDKGLNSQVISDLSAEVIYLTSAITDIAQKPVRERVAAALYMLYNVYFDKDRNVSDPINLTRESLANIVGTATETLIRILHDFKEEKLITSSGRKITVTDLHNLQRIGGIY